MPDTKLISAKVWAERWNRRPECSSFEDYVEDIQSDAREVAEQEAAKSLHRQMLFCSKETINKYRLQGAEAMFRKIWGDPWREEQHREYQNPETVVAGMEKKESEADDER